MGGGCLKGMCVLEKPVPAWMRTHTLHLSNSLPSFQILGDAPPPAPTIVCCSCVTLGRGLGNCFGAFRSFFPLGGSTSLWRKQLARLEEQYPFCSLRTEVKLSDSRYRSRGLGSRMMETPSDPCPSLDVTPNLEKKHRMPEKTEFLWSLRLCSCCSRLPRPSSPALFSFVSLTRNSGPEAILRISSFLPHILHLTGSGISRHDSTPMMVDLVSSITDPINVGWLISFLMQSTLILEL